MGKWARLEYERQLICKVKRLFELCQENPLAPLRAGDGRFTTFIQNLDPENKDVQARFTGMHQAVLRSSGNVADASRSNLDMTYSPPRLRRTISRRNALRRTFTGPGPHRLDSEVYDPIIPHSPISSTPDTESNSPEAQPLSPPRSPSARRRSQSPSFSPSRSRYATRPERQIRDDENTDHDDDDARTITLNSPGYRVAGHSGAGGGGTSSMRDAVGGGAANASSPPHSPSRAWLEEYQAHRPQQSSRLTDALHPLLRQTSMLQSTIASLDGALGQSVSRRRARAEEEGNERRVRRRLEGGTSMVRHPGEARGRDTRRDGVVVDLENPGPRYRSLFDHVSARDRDQERPSRVASFGQPNLPAAGYEFWSPLLPPDLRPPTSQAQPGSVPFPRYSPAESPYRTFSMPDDFVALANGMRDPSENENFGHIDLDAQPWAWTAPDVTYGDDDSYGQEDGAGLWATYD